MRERGGNERREGSAHVFLLLCGCLSENVSAHVCVCLCVSVNVIVKERERQRRGSEMETGIRGRKRLSEGVCALVSFQEAMPLAPNILQLCHLNDSISIGHLCVYHGYRGQNVQGRDTLPPSFNSLSYSLFLHNVITPT